MGENFVTSMGEERWVKKHGIKTNIGEKETWAKQKHGRKNISENVVKSTGEKKMGEKKHG